MREKGWKSRIELLALGFRFEPPGLYKLVLSQRSIKLSQMLSHQAKAIELLRPFCFAIEKRHPSKYSLWQKRREREKKTMLVYL